jgi:hypothetical protein
VGIVGSIIGIHYSLPLSAAVLLIAIVVLLSFAPKSEARFGAR